MRKFKIENIDVSLGIFLDDEIEAEDRTEAIEQVLLEICDNIGNYIDIELEEVIEDEDEE